MVTGFFPDAISMSNSCGLCNETSLDEVYTPERSTRGIKVYLCRHCGLVQSLPRIDHAPRRGAAVSSGADWGNVRYGKGFRTKAALDAITRLHKPPAQISGGQILYTRPDGTKVDVLGLDDRQLRDFRWEELSIVFQSAMHALNPILRVGEQIEDAIKAHRPEMSDTARAKRVVELLQLVGIQPDRVRAYPHELSGGMRQRAMIAIGLALDPEIIVMDEPTTALDVVIQRQIVEKIMELKDRLGFSVIFITHDLSLLIELSDTIVVMYAGKLVERAAAQDFYRDPKHPYSRSLLSSFPTLSGPKRELTGIPGTPPDLRKPSPGCAFNPRCPLAFGACIEVVPRLYQLETPTGRTCEAACLVYDEQLGREAVATAPTIEGTLR